MSRICTRLAVLLLVLPAAALAASLELLQSIPLAVTGRIDHLAVDASGQRLFVAALGNHTLEIVDLAAGQVVRSIDGLGKPQGVAHVAAANAEFVADGARGAVVAFDAKTLAPMRRVESLPDADNLRYDAAAGHLYVGYGDGAIRVLDAATATTVADIKLPAHPEGFALAPKSGRLVVNLPDAGAIGVVDLAARRLAQTWPLQGVRANFALALDEGSRRVFVATRSPPTILVLDLESGRRIASLPTCGDVDDIFFGGEEARLYAICGAGFVDVFRQVDAARYEPVERIRTREGARTGLYVAEQHRLYVAAPRRSGAGAEVRVYAVH